MKSDYLTDIASTRFLAPILLATSILLAAPWALLSQVAPQPPSPTAYDVKIVKTWIAMPDGVRLAASLYMPTGGNPSEKFPALLEYLPYRKDDGTAERDFPIHSYFAHPGYVSARVDIRGTGASEGNLPEREYSQQEQKDGEQVIAWLARQPWSTGNVGMFGISWGGFNSIQMAMRQPPALKAIIAMCATEDLYREDVHYFEGMLHWDEFELDMDLEQAMSRSPDFPVDDNTLKVRFDAAPWSLSYMKHQRDGAFWREPVRPLDSINIPVFMIGGMLDGYRDSIPRMLEQLKVPTKAIIGPWNHTFPHDAVPGPAIEWRDQAVRWWDNWLKDRDTGIMRESPIAVYMQNWHAPDLNLQSISGEWRNEASWPPPEAKPQAFYLNSNHSLQDSPAAEAAHQLKYIPSSGVEIGFWWGDLTPDQRPADAHSLVYDSAPLTEDVAILGRPQVQLRVSTPVSQADWITRLSDVAPDGTVTLVTGAGVNGAQRDSATDPTDLEPNRAYSLEVKQHLTSWVFPKGHRIRLAISNSWWPAIWPTPYSMTTSLYLGGLEGSRLSLPLVPVHSDSRPNFALPEPSEHLAGVHSEGYPWPGEYSVTRDQVRQSTRVNWRGSDSSDYPWGKRSHHEQLTYDLEDARPETNRIHGVADSIYRVKSRTITYRGELEMSSDIKNLYYSYKRTLVVNHRVIRQKVWRETIPRDHQ